ncbi:MAG: hypothetical protein ACJ8FU_08550 [Xanthobacteraceae bacterium]
MIIDRDPGDENDAPERAPEPSEFERVTLLLAGTGSVSQGVLERLLLAQRQHHQGR